MKRLSEKEQQIDDEIRARIFLYPDLLEDYYDALISENKSYSTAQTYIKNIARFLDYQFGSRIPQDFYSQIGKRDIEKYLDSLHSVSANSVSGSATNASKANSWSALNSFFQFLIPNYISFNPISGITRPAVEKNKEIISLTDDEVSRLINHAIESANPQLRNRDICILMLGVYCGMKTSQIIQCNVSDIDFNTNRIQIRENSSNASYIPLPDNVRIHLRKWLTDRSKMLSNQMEDALFISMKQNRISDDMICVMLKKYSSVLQKQVSFQVLRNTYIVNLFKRSKDINQCIEYLNLTNIPTTQKYIEQLIVSANTIPESNTTQSDIVSLASDETEYDDLRIDEIELDDLDDVDFSDSFETCNSNNSVNSTGAKGLDTVLRSLSDKQRCEMLRHIRKEIALSNGIEYHEKECNMSDCRFSEGCSIYLEEVSNFEKIIHQRITAGKHISFSKIYLSGRRLTPDDSIQCLNLSIDSYQRLRQANIDAVGELVNLTEKQIFELPRMTYSCAIEIIGRLHVSGLSLKQKTTSQLNKPANSSEALRTPRQSSLQRNASSYGMTIEELDFSVRTYNTLKRAGINMVFELCQMTRNEILKIRHMRTTILSEIEEKLRTINLTIRPDDY